MDHPLIIPFVEICFLNHQDSSRTGSRTICTHGALMQHFQTAGFSEEVSRLPAAPRRPSTNNMYDDSWLRFVPCPGEQGFDPLSFTAAQIATFFHYLFDSHGLSPQTVKGYRTCLASVLSRTGKVAVVHNKIISDMISSMELNANSSRMGSGHCLRGFE